VVVVAAVYLGLSFAPFWPAWSHGPTHWLQSRGSQDVGQAVFFMGAFPAALIHGVNPLANSWTNWPYGANYMDNTSVPLLAALLSPVTLATNPIFSLNLLFTLTTWADCLVCYLVVHYLTRNRLAAFIAGLAFGFSPMATGGASSHVQVLFDLLPPVAFLLLWRLCTGMGRPVWNGVALGGCLAAQVYVFTESLADCGVVAAVGLAYAAIKYRRELPQRLAPFLRGAAAAGACFLVVGGYGLYMEVAGPVHIHGPAHQDAPTALSADLLSPVLPGHNQRFHLGLGDAGNELIAVNSDGKMVADKAENGSYVGISLLVVLVIGVAWLWRNPLVRWSAGLAIVSLVLSMGGRLDVDNHSTAVRLPFDVLAHLPLLNGAVPSRFAMIEWFFLALLLGIILAELYQAIDRGGAKPVAASLAVVAVAGMALIPLVPAWAFGEGVVPLPSLAVGTQLRSLPVGQIVLGYPFPTLNTNLMVFQAEDRMRFRLVGAAMIQRAANGENLDSAAPPSLCQSILNSYFEPKLFGTVAMTPAALVSCAGEMLDWNVHAVLWTDLGSRPGAAKAFFTALLGQPTVDASDSSLWLDPLPALRAVIASGGAAAEARTVAAGLG